MNKAFKILLYSLLSMVGLIVIISVITYLTMTISANRKLNKAAELQGPEVKILTIDGFFGRRTAERRN